MLRCLCFGVSDGDKSHNATRITGACLCLGCPLRGRKLAVLTVVAVRPGVGRHGAVACEVLPQLDAHAHVGTGVLLAGRTWTCVKVGDRRRRDSMTKRDFLGLKQRQIHAEGEHHRHRHPPVGGNSTTSRCPTWTEEFHLRPHLCGCFYLMCR